MRVIYHSQGKDLWVDEPTNFAPFLGDQITDKDGEAWRVRDRVWHRGNKELIVVLAPVATFEEAAHG